MQWISSSTYERREGMVFKTDPRTGQLYCANPGKLLWSSAWPPEALARIAELEAEVRRVGRGEREGGG